ncbi:hypothetical protein GDO86_005376 [Hymenochirus boettgeri]|uniref:Uncharacterized protein n=1 Tax=Hymenochirus boettgeri TaxID=247094 RepID=A0A8T2J9M0_9PIPI|nr:hypothetical protein GDO86_005376 [Hymenochirus boettgeri]
MKIPDSYQLGPDEFYILADPWRQEWEKGVQVPANLESAPHPQVRLVHAFEDYPLMITHDTQCTWEFQTKTRGSCRYDLDEIDACWLELVNMEFKDLELPQLDELTVERVIEALEINCLENMNVAIQTEEGLGIEYDEDVVCDVCRSPEGEDGNEMVFCDKCNVCVHQACYGILKVPTGSWLCRSCALGVQAKCLLCPKRGGALKPTRSGTKWVHVSCALWIPEVSIGCPEKMEPITKISHIPPNRWALSCSLCKECTGTCIQCSMPSCITAFHVTCAFDHCLEMHTTLAENDEVKFKSFCVEHSSRPTKPEDQCGQRSSFSAAQVDSEQTKKDLEKVTLRKQKLLELEEDFFELVKPEYVAKNLCINRDLVDFVYQYWKLKRKANFNKPLVTPKTDEVDNLAQQEQDVLYRRLNLFTHLRQDLERVRNLCYMITRREKMKHSTCRIEEQIFQLQMKLIEKNLHDERSRKDARGRKNYKRKGRERKKGNSEKKGSMQTEHDDSVLEQLGFSTSFPIDRAFFSSWLAQSVQITTENMKMNQWSLNNSHCENDSSGLLSEELLQDEETLLSFMMDNSLKSPFKESETIKKVKGKTKMKGKKKMSRNNISNNPSRPHDQLAQWNNLDYMANQTEKTVNQNSKSSKSGKGKGISKVHVDYKGPNEKKSSKRGSTHSPNLKANVSNVNLLTNAENTLQCAHSEPNLLVKVPVSLECPKTVVSFKLPKGVESKFQSTIENPVTTNNNKVDKILNVKCHLDEIDGYYSDAEMTNSEEESSKGIKHNKFESSNDDIVRMSILAS